MKINKDKSIGRVLFIVEGVRTEFSLFRRIFCDVLGYEYIEKRRNNAKFFKNKNKSTSKVAVINTEGSNISSICDNNDYLDRIFEILISEYNFPVDNAAIYYIFDRDAKSNLNKQLIEKLIGQLKNAYENDNGERGGVLLLSYPSIEAYIVSNFIDDTYLMKFEIGDKVKEYITTQNKIIQLNKITAETIEKAANEMMKYFKSEEIDFCIDNIGQMNEEVFKRQETEYNKQKAYNLVSLLSIAFIDLGIIEE
ncbi:MAG TPA: hypothetical protein PK033_05980 [Acetivibrio sp.]|nr:hypothetical protein [Acetivibrio sp.]HQA57410.1 hypothetical protein [Acetivibrio sp.]